MAKINATNIGVYVADNLVAAAQSGELSLSANMIETTSKDSGGDSEFIPGLRSGTMSVEALYEDIASASNENQSDLFDDWKAGTLLTLKWGYNTAGEEIYSASGYVSSWSASAPMEDVATYSVEFQLTGAVTKSTVA
ncbi:MAG: phage tail tube protein [Flavobacteriaceae bacterium]